MIRRERSSRQGGSQPGAGRQRVPTVSIDRITTTCVPAVNLAGLVARAARDGIQLTDAPQSHEVGAEVLRDIQASRAAGGRDWMLNALAVEASLAVEDDAGAAAALIDVANDERVDNFSLANLRRQLIAVWGLNLESEPGRSLVCLLDAAILSRRDGRVVIDASVATGCDVGNGRQPRQARGHVRLQAAPFTRLVSARAGAHACRRQDRLRPRPQLRDRPAHLRRQPARSLGDSIVLVTSAHVLSPDASVADALRPGVATVVSTTAAGAEVVHRVAQVLFTSPPDALDVTVAELDPPVTDTPSLTVATAHDISVSQRVVLIGHTRGKQLTLEEGDLLHRDDAMVYYRCPTGPGTSGSPVFDERWRTYRHPPRVETWGRPAVHGYGRRHECRRGDLDFGDRARARSDRWHAAAGGDAAAPGRTRSRASLRELRPQGPSFLRAVVDAPESARAPRDDRALVG